jgi:hypothetical protein
METATTSLAASVVINTYGDGLAHLLEAVQSYLDQEGVDVQVIVSSVEGDPSVAALQQQFRDDERVEFCVTPLASHPGRGAQGVYWQLNRALERVRHPWFSYASGNDKALPTKLRHEIELCTRRDKLVCYSSYYATDETLGCKVRRGFHDYDYRAHLEHNFVSDCALAHSSLLESFAPFRLRHGNHAYWDFWLRVHEGAGDVFTYNPEPQWLYRHSRHSGKTRRWWRPHRAAGNALTRDRMLREHRRQAGGYGAGATLRRYLRLPKELIAQMLVAPRLGPDRPQRRPRGGATDPQRDAGASGRSLGEGPLLVTERFPYGDFEQFLETEVRFLASAYERVLIAPMRAGGPRREVPQNVDILPPLLPRHKLELALGALLNTAPLRPFGRLLLQERAYTSWARLRRFVKMALKARYILAHGGIEQSLSQAEARVTALYCYWSLTAAMLYPFATLRKLPPRVSRFHGWDLYEERTGNDGYIPLRRALLESLDWAVCISEHGAAYLGNRYADVSFERRVLPLGTIDHGRSRSSEDGVLRIVTCSLLTINKRVDLLIDALGRLTTRVEWTHLGDGRQGNALRKLARERLGRNVSWCFPGLVPNAAVLEHYQSHPCDLFVNVSASEGLPVSIMEALSCGIPVLATDVGGVSEIIDQDVGELLPADVSAAELAVAIERFEQLTPEAMGIFRENARRRWEERCQAQKNYGAFVDFLRSVHRPNETGAS